MKYLIQLIGINILNLTIMFILTSLFNVNLKWWIVIALTSSHYIVSKYLENKEKSKNN